MLHRGEDPEPNLLVSTVARKNSLLHLLWQRFDPLVYIWKWSRSGHVISMLSCYQLHLIKTSVTYRQDMQTGSMDRRTRWSCFCGNLVLLNKPFQLWTLTSFCKYVKIKVQYLWIFSLQPYQGADCFLICTSWFCRVLRRKRMCAIEVRRGAAWCKSACLSGIPGFIAAPDFSWPFADVAWCRNMLQPDERARIERFKREKVEKRKRWGNRDKSLWDHTEEPEKQRELEGKQLQKLLIVLLSFPIIFKQAALI